MLDDTTTTTADAVKHLASASAYGHRFVIAEGDATRIARLTGDISDRLAEIAEIFADTTGVAREGGVPRFVPHADRGPGTYVEIIRRPAGDGCLVTLEDGTTFFEFPCSSS